jgi:hypothetical protein
LADIEDGIWETYKDDGVLLYGVNNENSRILLDFIEQTGITFPVITGNPQGYTILGGQSPFPRDYIIDPEGFVQYAATEYRPTEMSAIIDRFLPTGTGGEGEGGTTGPGLPRGFMLQQNYPNPFNPSTTIKFELNGANIPADVELFIFSVRGRLVKKLVSSRLDSGSYAFHCDGTDDRGAQLPSGTYIYRLKVGADHSARKMLIAR